MRKATESAAGPRPRPTRAELEAARGKTVPDVIGSGLNVLFCGINPGLYSGATGHHFARPGNRFWPALWKSGFTPRLIAPFEEHLLLDLGLGITNLVSRTTATADQLDSQELVAGARVLERKLRKFQPAFVGFLGLSAYRTAFGRKQAKIGLQAETIGETRIWVLPNPSGLNAHYQLADLARLFAELRVAAE